MSEDRDRLSEEISTAQSRQDRSTPSYTVSNGTCESSRTELTLTSRDRLLSSIPSGSGSADIVSTGTGLNFAVETPRTNGALCKAVDELRTAQQEANASISVVDAEAKVKACLEAWKEEVLERSRTDSDFQLQFVQNAWASGIWVD